MPGAASDEESNSASEENETGADSGDNVYENGLPKEEEITLQYGYFEGGLGRDWVDYAIETFEEAYPNVTIEILSSPDIAQILSTRISAGDDEAMFDIFNIAPSGGIVSLAESGKIEPLDEIWEKELPDADVTVKDLLMDGLYESVDRIDGVSYEIPTSASVGGLFFDKLLFEENGWNQ